MSAQLDRVLTKSGVVVPVKLVSVVVSVLVGIAIFIAALAAFGVAQQLWG